MGDSFTHLHLHTEYSMLDGAARVKDVVAAAAADGQPAVGITDHGNMYGILDFYQACRDQGVKPILGTEAYQAYDSRLDRPSRRGRVDDTGGEAGGGQKLYYHLTLLAENEVGYKNLIQLSSRAYLEGYYYKPRVDWDLLESHHEGLIATTGCLGGQVLQSLLQGDYDSAVKKAARLQDIFGRDNLFVEIQDHGIPEQRQTNPQLLEIARQIGAPLLATNDSHYTHRADATAHDALLCVQTGSLRSDPNRFKFHGDEHYLKSSAEMRDLFRDIPESCDNTLWIAERCDVEISFGKPLLPDFAIPEGFADATAYLEHLTFEGARARWGEQLPDAVVERLAFELKVIADMGFSSYFLIVWDLIRHAKDSNIRVGPGRGSAAGCAVAYCLSITELDPIKYDLLFERFLNPSRISMPDIDMDFDSRYRDEMIRYAAERYGRDHVAQIVTFSQIKARAAVRDAARVLGHPYAVGDKIAKAMPPLVMGRDTPLEACLELKPKYEDGYKMAADLRQMYDDDPDAREVIEVARGLEGLRRQDGIHAAAVVITKDPLTDYLPIQRKPESGQDPADAPVVTQYEMHGVEDLGLLKMDFLGLRNLDVISDTIELIKSFEGIDLDIDHVPLDDEPTYELLRRGDSIGVFQLEGGPMRALMRSLAPTGFEDVAALVALYRPGPMAANMHNDYADRKNGRKTVDQLHPDAEDILGPTYGLMIYQEAMMRIAQRFAGYSLAEADNLRKACLPAGTLVLTKQRGYVPIEKLMSLSDRRVQTIDVDAYTTRHEPVADVWSVGRKQVYRLVTSTGYRIEATDNHPFLVEDQWRELRHVSPGDLVAVAAQTSTNGGSKVTDAEAAAEVERLATSTDRQARVDPRLVNAGLDQVERFLQAFASRVGWDDANGLVLASEHLGLDLKRMLLRHGVVATLRTDDRGHVLSIPADRCGFFEEFSAPVPHDASKNGVTSAEWQHVAGAVMTLEHPAPPRTGDLVWDTVVSIEAVGERECFDFQMENPARPYAVVEDFLVHNCGKKDRALIAKERQKFEAGCDSTGYGKELGKQWFDIIEPFADYAFNKSHSYGYGLVSYQTAYLKANHPAEYLAALLTSVKTNLDKAAVYLAECRSMGLTVLVPDINRSQSDFVPARLEGGEVVIPFGLSAVRNVGAGLVSHLLAEREANGPFDDFYDFCSRVDATVLNKRAIESLIKAGAFDSLGHPRKGMLVVFEQIVDQALARRREEEKGVMSLFDDLGGTEAAPLFDERVPIPPLDFDKKEKLAFEKEMLGLYVSDHPLMGAEDALRRRTDGTIEELAELSDGTSRIVGGVVTGLQRKYTKKGDLMAVFTLEDLRSTVEVMVFPKTMTSIGHLLADDAVVIVRGRVDKRDETPKLIAVDVTVFDGIVDGAPPLRIKVRPERLDERSIGKLKALLSEFPGESRVFLHLDDRQVLRLPVAHCVETGTALSAELRVMFGPDAIIG